MGFKVQLCTKALGDYIPGTSTVSIETQTLLILVLPKTTKNFPQMTHSWLQKRQKSENLQKLTKFLF